MKRLALFLPLLAAGLFSGCVATPTKPPLSAPSAIVTPDSSLAGRVISYNSAGRFVVLSFSAGPMPQMNQPLFLYRAGLKVAEVKITGPQRDSNIIADLLTGDARAGDEARDR